MNNNNPDKNQLVVEYIVKFTEKLAKTFIQLNEIGSQLLKNISPHEKNKFKGKEREKVQDLNSNLVNADDEEINGIATRTKVKMNKRIQQAQEEEYEPVQVSEKNQKKLSKTIQQKNDRSQKLTNQQTKKKTKLVSHKPKAPTSSFLLFFKQQQNSIAKSYPNYGVVELTKVAAKCWNQLSVQQKEPYQKLFEAERKKYQQEMQIYRREFPEEVRQKQLEKKQRKKKKAKQKRQKETKPKQVKQKYLPIQKNYDPNAHYKITPGGDEKVKLEHKAQEIGHKIRDPNEFDELKDEAQIEDQYDQLEESEEQQNSLGEDI